MKKDKKAASTSRKLETLLNFPTGSLSNLPRLEVLSNIEIHIEGYESILEYDENEIEIQTHQYIIRFVGIGLNIDLLDEDALIIKGQVFSIEFKI